MIWRHFFGEREFLVFPHSSMYITVWKLINFSVTQILCEIKVGESRVPKTAIITNCTNSETLDNFFYFTGFHLQTFQYYDQEYCWSEYDVSLTKIPRLKSVACPSPREPPCTTQGSTRVALSTTEGMRPPWTVKMYEISWKFCKISWLGDLLQTCSEEMWDTDQKLQF